MPGYELAIVILVGGVVALGGAISLYVLARAYFGGRSNFRPAPAPSRR